MAKLRYLLKPSDPWVWNEKTNDVFEQAKEVIADKVEEGVRLFEPKLPTDLLTEWCQDGHVYCHAHESGILLSSYQCRAPD